MVSGPEPSRWSGTAAVGLSATALFFGTGLHPIWWLTWIASAPILLFAYRARLAPAAAAAMAAWFLGGTSTWPLLHGVYHLPAPVVLALLLVPALGFTLAVLLSRALVRGERAVAGLIAFPAAWGSFEYLLSVVSPHGTAFGLAYSQMDCLALLQLAAVTGVWGISFAVLSASSAIAVAVHTRKAAGPAVTAALLAVALGWGGWRLRAPTEGGLTVGLAVSDTLPPFDETPSPSIAIAEAYAERVERLATAGAEVIVFPELVAQNDAAAVFEAAAVQHRVPVVVGLLREEGPLTFNQASIFAPDGTVATYDKHHLVPGWEDHFQPGSTLTVLPTGADPWGVQICKDLDFPALSRRYAAQGVGLMLVPAWDKDDDGWLHARMAVMRGVEGGFGVARAAKQGLLTVSDARGRVLAEARSSSPGFPAMLAELPVTHVDTLYSRLGDGFAWLALLATAASTWFAFQRR